MLRCDFDESGSSNDPKTTFTIVSGLIAPVAKWLEFEPQWRAVLKEFGVSVQHMKDYAASRGEFEAWKGDDERRRLYLSALIDCIEGTVIYAASGYIHRDTQPLNAPKTGLSLDGRKYQECLMFALHSCSAIRNRLGTEELVEVVVAENAFDWQSHASYKRLEAWPQPLGSFTLGSPQKLLPLQAADLFVWEYAKRRNDPRKSRKSWERLGKIPHMDVGCAPAESYGWSPGTIRV